MSEIPADLLSRACRIFLEHAYPEAPIDLPAQMTPSWDIPADAQTAAYLTPSPQRRGLCQQMSGVHAGYRLRLGCAAFPHLKLTIQVVPSFGEDRWLFGVD